MRAYVLKRRIEDQEGECCYCGKKIRWYHKLGLAFDNHGIAHLKCCRVRRG